MLDTVPLDDAHVGGVGEDLGQALPGDRRGLAALDAPVGQAPVGELTGKALESPFSGGVEVERSGDERGALGVGDDAGHLASGDDLAEVEIAERCSTGKPRILAFWVRPFRISDARLAE